MHIKLKIAITILGICALALAGVFYYQFNPSESIIFPKCPIYSFTGYYCSGCGSQRAIHQILNGNILEGFKHNLLILLLLIVLLYDLIIKLTRTLFNKKLVNFLHYSKTTYIILFTVILFGILRNINIFPFTVLAP